MARAIAAGTTHPKGTTIHRKVVDAIVTAPTRPRLVSAEDDSLVHGSSGAALVPDSKVAIHDNKTFRSRLQTDESPPDKSYRDNEKDTVWYRLAERIDGADAYLRSGTFKLDPAGADLASMLKVAARQGLSLKLRIAMFVEGYGSRTTAIDVVLPYIEVASAEEKRAVLADSVLMAEARRTLDRSVYLALFPALQMHEKSPMGLPRGGPRFDQHFEGPEADKHISDYMQLIGMDAVTKGRKVTGEVSVVSGKVWEDAFFRQWGPFGYKDPSICSAFVDVNQPKRHIWVNRDDGDPGTVLHEGMHKYADPHLRDSLIAQYGLPGISQIDEGLTEVFTRDMTVPLGITRQSYPAQYVLMTRLRNTVGTSVITNAYFAGKYADLVRVWESKQPDDWNTFSKAMEDERYPDAVKMV